MKPELRARLDREQRQYKIWAASFQAKLRSADSLTLTHRHMRDFIATVTREGEGKSERYRLTTWRPNGPNGHEFYSAEQLSHEVYHSWWIDPSAADRLDSWMGQPAWVLGMLQLEYLELWNEHMAHGRSAICHAMDEAAAAAGLTAGILRGREIGEN